MIVADASAIVEVLLAMPRAGEVRAALAGHSELHVPEHFPVEALSALRRYTIRGELIDARAAEALAGLRDLRALTYPVIELTADIWDLREVLTAYDAAYLALARQLDVGLVTLDGGLAAAASKEGRLAIEGVE
ncbi:MAG TPA: type II toxin-antitoxin system VapC family toxin [Solirubrobacteraceae bacterium]|nr:type II toxin-antitoxin system VapC family toxin [Solirubrobacteraceae bacterium]